MSINWNATRALLSSIVFAMLLGSLSTQVCGQYVRHIRGPLDNPRDLKKGDKVPVGQVISTGNKGRVILEYQNIPDVDGRAGYGYVIINRNEKYKVPEKLLESGPSYYPRGSADDLRKTTGIRLVILYGPPGASGSPSRGINSRALQGIEALLKEFNSELDKTPLTFSGQITSLDKEKNSVDVRQGNESYKFRVTPETKVTGAQAVSELLNKEVWIEYVENVHLEYKNEPGTGYGVVRTVFRDVVLLMPTQSADFYSYLGFEEQASYTGNCADLQTDKSCIKFDDGYIWFVQDKVTGLQPPDTRYQLNIQKAAGTKAEYEHILRTSFVMKTNHGSRD